MIFPKCMIGRAPQITYEGYVLPCCWIPYEKKLEFIDSEVKDNPFFREDFNLYNNSLINILYSAEWQEMLENIYSNTPKKCKNKCSNFIIKNNKAKISNIDVPKINPSLTSKEEWQKNISSDFDAFKIAKEKFKVHKDIQLETTSRCSLKCPYCQRTVEAGTGKYFKSDLTLDILKDIFFTHGVEDVIDCGRYGDPSFYPYYHNMLDLLIDSPLKTYRASIAATGHKEKWWSTTIDKLVKVRKSGTEPIVTFGIDGLEDTSKIHRKGQNFYEIWNAMINCHQAGIKVIWQVIPTSANEHQIKEIQDIAGNLGIEISIVLSNRFRGENDLLQPKNPNLFF